MSDKITTEMFIKKAKEIHGDKYDYSKTKYITMKIAIKIKCPIHGIFLQLPGVHYNSGCRKCYFDSLRLTTEEFIEKAKIKHGEQYDYSEVVHVHIEKPVIIKCNKHGKFLQKPAYHLKQQIPCRKCHIESLQIEPEYFFRKANNIHNNFYDYSKTKFVNTFSKIKIRCPKHGIFTQLAGSHYTGTGCPKCKLSKGNCKILKVLDSHKIKYTIEKSFEKCKDKNKLKFDFYLPQHRLCIEYDGEQHFRPIKYFGGIKTYTETIKRDKIKNDFCKNNNIKLIRIPYTEFDNIEQILEKEIPLKTE